MTEDKDILEIFNEGGRKDYAFNLLVRKYSERLYWHIRRMVNSHEDADDILQNSLVKVWNSLDSFRGDSQLYTWLYKIATNETISFLKKERLRRFLSLESKESASAANVEADRLFNGDKVQAALQNAIGKLPPRQRAVFKMRYFDELKYEEMAEILDLSTGALKASYHHAYNKVLEELKKLD